MTYSVVAGISHDVMRIRQSLTADPVNGLNFSSVFVTTAFFLKKSKSMVMRAGLTETVTVGRCQHGVVSFDLASV